MGTGTPPNSRLGSTDRRSLSAVALAQAHLLHAFGTESSNTHSHVANKCLISNGAGRGDRTPMSLRPKVFETLVDLAPTVTIGHVWSTISNLAASIFRPFWQMVPSGSSWCWHKIDTLAHPSPK